MKAKLTASLAAASVAWLVAEAASPAFAEQPVRLGVAGDMSGPYSAFGGTGSVLAAQMAAEGFVRLMTEELAKACG